MKTITSVSGGATSSMMALKYPTDYYVFAVVLTEHKPSAPRDSGLLRECQKRIPHFVASHESDLTLVNVLRLEQEIGKEIHWVASSLTFDGLIAQRKALPNARTRFCTEKLKLEPIFHHCYFKLFDGSPLLFHIGFRWDEPHRVNKWTCNHDKYTFPYACRLYGSRTQLHKTVQWKETAFPLYEDRITKQDVNDFWRKKGWEFPAVSNCRFCFHHRAFQQQYQARLEPDNLEWWLEQEARLGKTFGKRALKEIIATPLLDVVDTDSSCFCSE